MISIKKIIKDILYVSKLTGISKKKITVTLSVILSQFSAYLDIFIIVTFAGIITGNYEGIDSLQSLFIFINENKYFLVILVVTRFWFMYLQISLLKRLEINVKKNIQVYFLQGKYLIGEIIQSQILSFISIHFLVTYLFFTPM